MTAVSCTQINDTTGLCSTLEGVGYGLGSFIGAIASALPYLVLILAVVGGVVLLISGIARAIEHSVSMGFKTR